MATSLLILLLPVLAVMAQPDFEMRNYRTTALGAHVDKSSIQLLREAIKANKDESVVTSPLGVMILLSLYSAGTDGKLRDDITKFLSGGVPGNYSELSREFSELTHEFSSFGNDYLTIANKIYVEPLGELAPAFVNTAKSFESEVEKLDFSNAAAAAATINKWSEEKTHGLIKNPVSEDAITPDVVAALFNVIFFKGHWHVPFKTENTKEMDFHVSKSQVVKKPMMKLLDSLYYRESPSLGARMIELPYKERGFRMIVVLPDEVDGLPAVLEKVADQGLLQEVSKLQPAGADVDLLLPKFEVKTKLNLNNILSELGLKGLFQDPATGILDGRAVTVSQAFQEAFIKVDEEGATAGAFTAIVGYGSTLFSEEPRNINFHVDHPFLYAILYQDTVLFIGTYRQ